MSGLPKTKPKLESVRNANLLIGIETKKCSKCGEEKSFDEFSKRKEGKLKLNSWCKLCCSTRYKEWEEDNAEHIRNYSKLYYQENAEKLKEKSRKYRLDNPDVVKEKFQQWKIENPEYFKNYYEENKEEKLAYGKEYRKNNPEKCREWFTKRNAKDAKDPMKKLHSGISNLVRTSLKQGEGKGRFSVFKLLGYSCDDLRKHLESLFLTGMTWENHAINGWHIDHKIPTKSFHFTSADDEEFKQCWALSNLQPMWAVHNRKKQDKLDWEMPSEYNRSKE